MNSIEKNLAKAAGCKKVKVGEDIRCKVDLAVSHDVTGPITIEQFKKIGLDQVFDPGKVMMVIDHIFPAATIQARNNHISLKKFADHFGCKLFAQGQGVVHQLIYEEYKPAPGSIIIGADSHTCTAGGYGALGIGVGSTELAAAMATGTIDLEVPEVVEIFLTGEFKDCVTAKDLILFLINHFGTDGLTDKGVIFTGPAVINLATAEKMTICNMGIEMGAMISCFGSENAETDVGQRISIELGDLEPVVACPFSPANVKPLAAVAGIPITQVVVGSCTNGRLKDMEQVVNILKDYPVHKNVNMLVIPASQKISAAMEELGYCKIIRDAGAVLVNPGCGPCFGAHQGLASDDDVVVSTTNRNFPGRMGSRKAQVYLASPITAAVAAVCGKLQDPRKIAFKERTDYAY
ncbi:MAG: 3-isopropylmalate dehydratase large subunit [Peptococcaceae bacterium]